MSRQIIEATRSPKTKVYDVADPTIVDALNGHDIETKKKAEIHLSTGGIIGVPFWSTK